MAYFVPLPLPDGSHSVQAALTTPDGAHRISPPVTLVFAINQTLEYDEDGAAVEVEGEAKGPGGGRAGGGGGVMPASPELCTALVASLHGPNAVTVASANKVNQNNRSVVLL